MEFNAVSGIFPLMRGAELDALAEDIKQNGLLEPIVLDVDGKILDGRNRFWACERAGVKPLYRRWGGGCTPLAFVIAENLKRRHLNESQRAMVATRLANLEHGQRADYTAESQICDSVTQQQAADMLNISKRAVEMARAVMGKAPDLAALVDAGTMSVNKAITEIKDAEVKARLDELEAAEVDAPTGEYDVVVIDPPWPMEKIKRDVAPKQAGFDYPTMTEDELAALDIPTAEDCHVWVWTTHKFLPMALRLLPVWGCKYVCMFVWHKPGGFQPFGLPQYNCEFAVYARHGSPKFFDTKAFNVCFEAPRGAHSEKPAEFYDVVRRVTRGRRLDMFSRREIGGFAAWGKEAPQNE